MTCTFIKSQSMSSTSIIWINIMISNNNKYWNLYKNVKKKINCHNHKF